MVRLSNVGPLVFRVSRLVSLMRYSMCQTRIRQWVLIISCGSLMMSGLGGRVMVLWWCRISAGMGVS